MLILGIDVGASGALSLISGSEVKYAVVTKIKASKKGANRLVYYADVLQEHLLHAAMYSLADDEKTSEPIMVYIEEPPLVRSARTYGILMQYLAIAQVTVHQVLGSLPVMIPVPTWKSAIGCKTRLTNDLKRFDKKQQISWLKEYIYDAVVHNVTDSSRELLEGVAKGAKVCDVYDATGIALAGQKRFEETCELELE